MKKSIASLLTMGALSAMLAVAATGCAGTGKTEGTTVGTTAAGQSTAEKKENEASTTDGKGKKRFIWLMEVLEIRDFLIPQLRGWISYIKTLVGKPRLWKWVEMKPVMRVISWMQQTRIGI